MATVKMGSLSLLLFVAALVAVCAGLYPEIAPGPQIAVDSYPPLWLSRSEIIQRLKRDVTLDHKIGGGRVFGTLGGNEDSLFGKGGYERNIFNDHRGKLDGQAYGSRVLSSMGDSSHLGGALNWKANNNAAASLDLSRQIHGATTLNAQGGGVWPLGKNGDVSAMGSYSQTFGRGRPDVGANAAFNYRW